MWSVYLLFFLNAYETCPGHYGFSSLFFLGSNVGVIIEASLETTGSGSFSMKLDRFRIGVSIGELSMFPLVFEP